MGQQPMQQQQQQPAQRAFDYEDVEDRDGVRLSWNVFAGSRIESTRTVVPIAAVSVDLVALCPALGLMIPSVALYPAEGTCGSTTSALRARDLQDLPRHPQPLLSD